MSEIVLHLDGEAPPEPISPRTPHIGHAIFFLVFALGTVTMAQLLSIGVAHMMPAYHELSLRELSQLPKITVIASFMAYTLVLVLARLFFPTIWHRSFASGIAWNWNAVRTNWRWLVPAGICISVASAACESFLAIPKDLPVDKFFSSRTDLWLVSILGIFLAPAFEEICFRGFLLPAIAIAWDWLRLPRTPEARLRWQTTNRVSPTGICRWRGGDEHRVCRDARQAAQLYARTAGGSLLREHRALGSADTAQVSGGFVGGACEL